MTTKEDVWLNVYAQVLDRLQRSTVIRDDQDIRDEAQKDADAAADAFESKFPASLCREVS